MRFEDRELICRVCGKEFTFSAGEQEFFSRQQYMHDPKTCKKCRHLSGKSTEETTVICASCERPTNVPFVPRQGRPVFCRTCFDQRRWPAA